jgi:capsular polysaccharide export protein
MRAFLGGPMSRYRSRGPADRLAAWASRPNAAVREAVAAGKSVTFVEDGFLRSVGLGSSFHPASSLILDERGVYYDPGRPSDLEHTLNSETFDAQTLAEAASLREQVVTLGLSKYNLGGAALQLPPEAAGRRTILVPGPVENDASVLTGGGGLSNLDLLRTVRRDNPGALLIYKPHPDVEAGQRPGRVAASELARLADLVVSGLDITACIEAVDEVHTLTSLAGFEALLRGRPVACYGWPFYAGWGLTIDKGPTPSPRRRPASLDALVAASLIRYPLYLDPETWLPCDAATFVTRLAVAAASAPADGRQPPFGRVTRFANALRHILRPPKPPLY